MVEYRLRLRYNVGSGEQSLLLSFVNASDGQWHTAAVDRVGQWVSLTLDTAEGREVNQSLGQVQGHNEVQGHAELRVSQRGLLAGGDVDFHSSKAAPLVSHDFSNGTHCFFLLYVFFFYFFIRNNSINSFPNYMDHRVLFICV